MEDDDVETQWEDAYRATAQNLVATSDDVEVDDEAEVSLAEGGAWVQAWLWIDQSDVEG